MTETISTPVTSAKSDQEAAGNRLQRLQAESMTLLLRAAKITEKTRKSD